MKEEIAMTNLLTQQNITFILSLIGSLGTAWTVIQSRVKMDFKLHFFGYSNNKQVVLAYMQFINKSRLPIAITDVNVIINDVPYPCSKLPTIASSSKHEWSGQIAIKDFYNIPFPLEIGSLGATSGFLVFEIPRDIYVPLSMPLTFLISTNRGKTLKRSLLSDQVYSE